MIGGPFLSAIADFFTTATAIRGAAVCGTTVLGPTGLYEKLAGKLGANAFIIAPDVWAKMSYVARWTANSAFLDKVIARGDLILLAIPAQLASDWSFFAIELQYLMARGFTVGPGGMSLLHP
jgi:hypothetical protein